MHYRFVVHPRELRRQKGDIIAHCISPRYDRTASVMTHRITVERNTLRFAAAHFTTSGGRCELLHGHNYDVRIEVEGELTSDAWVLDFGEIKRLVSALCQELDHRFLLPLHNPSLQIIESAAEYEVRFHERRYVIPKGDVAPLPIDNSTAERLAQWLAGRLASQLGSAGVSNLHSITVGVEESPGQVGWFTLALGSQPPG